MTQMDLLHLTAIPDNVEELIEDVIIGIFGRMYRDLFAMAELIPARQYIDIPYKEFCAAPVETLARIYRQLELPGFAEARPRFEAFAAAQSHYRKNDLEIPARLVGKVNDALGFYLDHYGYERREAAP